MSDLSKKELDKLFKKGAEQYDFDYNPASWEQMETLINRDDRRRRILWWFFGGLAIFILVSSILLIGKNDSEKTGISTSSSEQEPVEKLELSAARRESGKAAKRKLESKQIGEQAFPNGKKKMKFDGREVEDSTSVRSLPSQPELKAKNLSGKNQNQKVPIARVHKAEGRIDKKSDLLALRFSSEFLVATDSVFAEKAEITVEQNRKKDALAALEILPLHALIFAQAKNLAPISVLSEARVTNPNLIFSDNPAGRGSAFVVGFNLATELNSVGVDNFSKSGWKAGVQMEFQFAGKYSLGLGANIIRKNYEANKGEFTPPKGFWTRKIVPNETDSKSTVLEIPLLLSFYARGYSNSGFYASGGITSYFMLRERYRFFYDLPDPDLIRRWGTENENRTWFGIGQISIGYYKRTGTKTAFKIAPYFQIPIRGVGHGNVKLYSMGMNFRFDFQIH